MKESLFEKFLQLLHEHIHKKYISNLSAISLQHWGELKNLEANTFIIKTSRDSSQRIFSKNEQIKLTKKSSKLISQLLYMNIIDESTFELIMNQLCFSESSFVTLHETTWTIHQTLVDNLNEQQLALLHLILYQPEEGIIQH